MAAEIPTTEPTSIIAGDTLAWTKSLADYEASLWTLTYYLRGPSAQTITATTSGGDFAGTKTAYQPGTS